MVRYRFGTTYMNMCMYEEDVFLTVHVSNVTIINAGRCTTVSVTLSYE